MAATLVLVRVVLEPAVLLADIVDPAAAAAFIGAEIGIAVPMKDGVPKRQVESVDRAAIAIDLLGDRESVGTVMLGILFPPSSDLFGCTAAFQTPGTADIFCIIAS
jgi:hypothetical protein